MYAEGGAEDQLVALRDHVAEHALGVGGLGHALDEAGRDAVAELGLEALACVVVARRSSRRRRPGRRRRSDLQCAGLGGAAEAGGAEALRPRAPAALPSLPTDRGGGGDGGPTASLSSERLATRVMTSLS